MHICREDPMAQWQARPITHSREGSCSIQDRVVWPWISGFWGGAAGSGAPSSGHFTRGLGWPDGAVASASTTVLLRKAPVRFRIGPDVLVMFLRGVVFGRSRSCRFARTLTVLDWVVLSYFLRRVDERRAASPPCFMCDSLKVRLLEFCRASLRSTLLN